MRRKLLIASCALLLTLPLGIVTLFAQRAQPEATPEAGPGTTAMMPGMMGGGMMGGGMGTMSPMMGQMGGGMMGMCPMCGRMMQMGGRHRDPHSMLLFARELQLSPEQKEKLEKLQLDTRLKTIDLQAEAQKADAKLEALLWADTVDLDAVRRAVNDAAQAKADLTFARIQAAANAEELLTREQKSKLKELQPKMMGPMASGAQMCPMMMQGMGAGSMAEQATQQRSSTPQEGAETATRPSRETHEQHH